MLNSVKIDRKFSWELHSELSLPISEVLPICQLKTLPGFGVNTKRKYGDEIFA